MRWRRVCVRHLQTEIFLSMDYPVDGCIITDKIIKRFPVNTAAWWELPQYHDMMSSLLLDLMFHADFVMTSQICLETRAQILKSYFPSNCHEHIATYIKKNHLEDCNSTGCLKEAIDQLVPLTKVVEAIEDTIKFKHPFAYCFIAGLFHLHKQSDSYEQLLPPFIEN